MIDTITGILLIALAIFILKKEIKGNWDKGQTYFDRRAYYIPMIIAMVILGIILAFTEVTLLDIFTNNN